MKKISQNLLTSYPVLMSAVTRFYRDNTASTIPIYAMGLLLLATASAATLSVNYRTNILTELQAAADSASLAATNVVADLKEAQATNGLSDAQILERGKKAAKAAYKLNVHTSKIELDDSRITIAIEKDGANKATAVSATVTPSGNVPIIMGGFLGDALYTQANVKAKAGRGIGAGTNVYTTTDTKKQRTLEVVLVLDITGSMGETISGDAENKIAGLRKAVKSFVNGIYGTDLSQTDATPVNIKVGIIPYSNSVNVGKLIPNEMNIPSDLGAWAARADSKGWSGCIVERSTTPNLVALDPVGGVTVRSDALDVRDAPQSVTPEKWAPYYNDPVEYYGRTTKTVTTGTYPNRVTKPIPVGIRATTNWYRPSDYSSAKAPLRLVRNSVAEYWHADNPTTTEGLDGNGNAAPLLTATSAATASGSPNSGCVSAALPMASGYTKKRISEYVDALSPGGWTHSNLGMAWANRMLSPWAPLDGTNNYGDGKTDKLIVLMTDGYITAGDTYNKTTNSTSLSASDLLTTSSVQNPAGYFRVDDSNSYDGFNMSWAGYYYGYGLSAFNHLVGSPGNDKPYSNASGHILAHQQRLLMACKVARTPEGYVGSAPATKVYTILFGFKLPSGARNIYEECATVPGYALTAESSSKLTEAFTKIANSSKIQLVE
jgi:hypothetical protein